MSYTITHANGKYLETISESTVNRSYPVVMVGKNVTNYGEIINDNYIWLLENFAGLTEPSNALKGMLFYNTASQSMKVCFADSTDGVATDWFTLQSIKTSISQTGELGEVTFNTNSSDFGDTGTNGDLVVWNGTVWMPVGPYNKYYHMYYTSVVTNDTNPNGEIKLNLVNLGTDALKKFNGKCVIEYEATIIATMNGAVISDTASGAWKHTGLIFKESEDATKIVMIGKDNVQTIAKTEGSAYICGDDQSTTTDDVYLNNGNLTIKVYGPGAQNVNWIARFELTINHVES